MFTGLIESLGTIIDIRYESQSQMLGIQPDMSDFLVAKGDSVAINGVCLTLEFYTDKAFYFRAVRETLLRTNFKDVSIGTRVNLERALKVSSRLDGHLVLGHVDGIGEITGDSTFGDSIVRTISIPSGLEKFMAEKGSVAIDGISLTIASCTDSSISISFIPHTLDHTTMGIKKVGALVNLECDIIARYLERLLKFSSSPNEKKHDISQTDSNLISLLERYGF